MLPYFLTPEFLSISWTIQKRAGKWFSGLNIGDTQHLLQDFFQGYEFLPVSHFLWLKLPAIRSINGGTEPWSMVEFGLLPSDQNFAVAWCSEMVGLEKTFR